MSNPAGQFQHRRIDQAASVDDRVDLLEPAKRLRRTFQADTESHRRPVPPTERHADTLAGFELVTKLVRNQVVKGGVQRAIEDNLGSQPVGPGCCLPGHRRIGVLPLRGRFRRQVKEALLA
ncbi:MAG: hypothetical protein CM1200mP2_30400 [Planctomycetaceae bacterium]|nr:MAG: hypothetical protein CM1200mP2_30400 [Planctomycetaceae bacterium]